MQLTKTNYKIIKQLLLFSPILVILAFCVLGDFLTPTLVEATVFTGIASGGDLISVSGAGDVQLSVVPSAAGGFIMGKEALTISTDAANGYQAYISMTGNDNHLYQSDGTTSLKSTNHAYASPSSIDTNSWGYAVPQSDNTNLESHNLFTSTDYDVVDYSTQERTTTWAGVPVKSDIQLIQSTSAASASSALNVYYAAKVNTSQSAGIYSGEVLYTVLAKSTVVSAASIDPSTVNNLEGGNTFTVTLGLNTTANDNIKNNSTVTIGDKACTVTGASNNGSGNLVLTCTDTKQFVTGRYDVTITVSDGTNNYGTYYISNGVEYRSVTSPHIAWMAPSAIYTGETVARPLRILTDIPTSDVTLDSATVTIGSNTCTSPTITTVDDHYMVSCSAPIGLSAGDYSVKVNLAKSGDTLVNLNASVSYSNTSSLYGVSDMQDVTTDICAITPTPSVSATAPLNDLDDITYDGSGLAQQVPSVTLLDKRDNQRYTVRKLADGNCWMTENLRFGATTNTAADTPNPWASTTDPATNTATTSTGAGVLANSTDGLIDTHIITVSSGAKGADGSAAFDNITEYYQKPYIVIYQANTVDNVSGTDTKFGVLYNYCAATGGTACTANGTLPTVSGSICPTNWSLPAFDAEVGTAAGTNPSYNNLTATYGIGYNTSTGVSKITSVPLSFPRAGDFTNGSLSGRSASGHGSYWSSSLSGGSSAFNLYFRSTSDINRGSYARRGGRSVRCIVAGS